MKKLSKSELDILRLLVFMYIILYYIRLLCIRGETKKIKGGKNEY